MDTKRIEQAIENAMVKTINNGDLFNIPYDERIDFSKELKEVYKTIDYTKVYYEVKVRLEEELAKKIVNKVITEMGTDIKGLMSHNEIREDFKFLMRKGVEEIMDKVKED